MQRVTIDCELNHTNSGFEAAWYLRSLHQGRLLATREAGGVLAVRPSLAPARDAGRVWQHPAFVPDTKRHCATRDAAGAVLDPSQREK